MTRVVLAFAILAVTASAAFTQEIKTVPMTRTRATDGPAMYNAYCASCHGLAGLGDGPASKALTKTPADLTRISARNGGSFPETKIRRYIEGADEISAHGSRDMPVWGSLFRAMDRDTVPVRIQALSVFLKSIQQ